MSRFAKENSTPIYREIPGVVTGVGASQTAVVKVPFNATYNFLELRNTIAGVAATRAELEAMLGEIRVLLGGRVVEVLNAKQFIALAEFYNTGIVGDTGVLVFDYQRLWMLGFTAQNEPSWGTLAETSFEIQIDQAAASTIDLIRVYAQYEAVASELGAHVRRLRVSPAITAVGHKYIADLPKIPEGFLYAIHMEVSTPANLTDVRFTADNIEIVNAPVAMLNRQYLRANPRRTVQSAIRTAFDGTTSGFVHLDFCARNYDSDAVKMVYDSHLLDLTIANAAPAVSNIILEVGSVEPSKLAK